MKILNKAICLVVFFAVGPLSGHKQEQQQPQPNQPAPAPQQPGQQLTYKKLHDTILTESPTEAKMFTNHKFSETFINRQKDNATKAEIGKEGLKALLQTARDKWTLFTGNDADDLGILKAINQQIDAAVQRMP